MTKKKQTPARRPTDATLRNVKAANTRLDALEAQVRALETRLSRVEQLPAPQKGL